MADSPLLTEPLWAPDDLGKAIPSWPDATSVCLPMWADNVGYEEGDSRVTDVLACGYPRFVFHPYCTALFEECERRFAGTDERCQAYPSLAVAMRFKAFLEADGHAVAIDAFGHEEIQSVRFPSAAAARAKAFWQHTGDGVSWRQAKAAIDGTVVAVDDDVHEQLRARIAKHSQTRPEDVFLFPCGMSAVFAAYRAVQRLRPDLKSVQFGFPYTDTLKIQQKFGVGMHFFANGDDAEMNDLAALLAREALMGIFCEFPSNPLLHSPDLNRLSQLARDKGVPLVVDETVGSFFNVSVMPPADMLATSLTKYYSGVGDVMAGALVLHQDSPHYEALAPIVQAEYEADCLYHPDAVVLEQNSRDYASRMARINVTTEALADFLNDHDAIETVYYPKFQGREHYEAMMTERGGYGGLLSVVLKDPAGRSAPFFDALQVSKGPSLGTSYALACPYTILAHYDELDFVESCGVSRYLIRISVGLEDSEDLINRFAKALEDS